jgi:hypothetical protein
MQEEIHVRPAVPFPDRRQHVGKQRFLPLTRE